jgi:hypothetical protein
MTYFDKDVQVQIDGKTKRSPGCKYTQYVHGNTDEYGEEYDEY